MLARLIMAAALLGTLSAPLLAQGTRPDARQMTCGQAQSLIKQRGAVVLTTGTYTYDRYIAPNGFCSVGEMPVMDTIPTRDDPQCRVYRCTANDRGLWPSGR